MRKFCETEGQKRKGGRERERERVRERERESGYAIVCLHNISIGIYANMHKPYRSFCGLLNVTLCTHICIYTFTGTLTNAITKFYQN